ncbi:MAG: S8 family serine peptidase [Nanoarchaeota archaeon]|nr:S8 family serine peptidase [Nanoarchaeota archaeon]
MRRGSLDEQSTRGILVVVVVVAIAVVFNLAFGFVVLPQFVARVPSPGVTIGSPQVPIEPVPPGGIGFINWVPVPSQSSPGETTPSSTVGMKGLSFQGNDCSSEAVMNYIETYDPSMECEAIDFSDSPLVETEDGVFVNAQTYERAVFFTCDSGLYSNVQQLYASLLQTFSGCGFQNDFDENGNFLLNGDVGDDSEDGTEPNEYLELGGYGLFPTLTDAVAAQTNHGLNDGEGVRIGVIDSGIMYRDEAVPGGIYKAPSWLPPIAMAWYTGRLDTCELSQVGPLQPDQTTQHGRLYDETLLSGGGIGHGFTTMSLLGDTGTLDPVNFPDMTGFAPAATYYFVDIDVSGDSVSSPNAKKIKKTDFAKAIIWLLEGPDCSKAGKEDTPNIILAPVVLADSDKTPPLSSPDKFAKKYKALRGLYRKAAKFNTLLIFPSGNEGYSDQLNPLAASDSLRSKNGKAKKYPAKPVIASAYISTAATETIFSSIAGCDPGTPLSVYDRVCNASYGSPAPLGQATDWTGVEPDWMRVDVTAPGGQVLIPRILFGGIPPETIQTYQLSGSASSSMAAAATAGAYALAIEAYNKEKSNTGLSIQEVRTNPEYQVHPWQLSAALAATDTAGNHLATDDVNVPAGVETGFGGLNVQKLADVVASYALPPELTVTMLPQPVNNKMQFQVEATDLSRVSLVKYMIREPRTVGTYVKLFNAYPPEKENKVNKLVPFFEMTVTTSKLVLGACYELQVIVYDDNRGMTEVTNYYKIDGANIVTCTPL